jgi:hypothetical protein
MATLAACSESGDGNDENVGAVMEEPGAGGGGGATDGTDAPASSPAPVTGSPPASTTPTTGTPSMPVTSPTPSATSTGTSAPSPTDTSSTPPSGGAPGNGGSPVTPGSAGAGPASNGGSPGTGGALGEAGAPSSAGTSGAGGNAAAGAASGGSGPMPEPCPVETPLTGGMEVCSNTRGNAGSGYGFELWAEGSGSGCMTVHGMDATFSASWNNVEDFLARIGLDFDQTRTHSQIGTITADFAETKTEEPGGLTYIGIYGWTTDPLREFYILDDWGETKPAGVASDGSPRDEVGTLEADGETYDVWKKTRENKPSIIGDATFDQYFSIRRTARQCGTISVSDHFNQWEELGLPLGNLYEVKWLLEAQFNSGSIAFTTANVRVE